MAESLFARSKFQAFLFAGGVIIVLAGLSSNETQERVIDGIVLIALSAMVLFALALIIHWFHRESDPSTDPKNTVTPNLPAWPTAYDVRIARGFMLLGMLIYIGYYFLDRFVVELQIDVQRLLYIRVAVSIVIMLVWLSSFTSWFQRNYVSIITATTSIAGIGVGAMMYVVGPLVQFYYGGFIQVIAFSAFAFRIPPRPLAWQCALLLTLYTCVCAYRSWVPGIGLDLDRAQQAILLNNLVSLATFVILALVASSIMARVQDNSQSSSVECREAPPDSVIQ